MQGEVESLASLSSELRAREQELSARIAAHAEAAADTRVCVVRSQAYIRLRKSSQDMKRYTCIDRYIEAVD